jgi:hypothetical protein
VSHAKLSAAVTLFVAMVAMSGGLARGQFEDPGGNQGGNDGPTGTLVIGGVGNPPEKNFVRLDATWDKCGNASGAKVTLYKGVKANPGQAVNVGELTASPAGASGKLGGDMSDNAKYKSGDTVFAVLKVVDAGNKVIVEKVAGDFTVP